MVSVPKVKRTPKPDYEAYTTEFDRVVTGVERLLPAHRLSHQCLPEPPEITEAHRDVTLRDEHIVKLLAYGNKRIESLPHIMAEADAIEVTDDTAISILFDLSGSSRGKPSIRSYAIANAFMRHAANTTNTNIEMNAFSTVAWKGGLSRKKWLDDGKPELPGRLNDLLSLKLNEFGQDVEESTFDNLAVLIAEGCSCENIDGESILWASHRLGQQPQSNKVLLIVSDDAPVDDATLSVNPGNYLLNHLDKVCSDINAEGIIKLIHLDNSAPFNERGEQIKSMRVDGRNKIVADWRHSRPKDAETCLETGKRLHRSGGALSRYPRHILSPFELAVDNLSEEAKRIVQITYDIAAEDVSRGTAFISHTAGKKEFILKP